mmetsp:Transcript_112291/g.349905  ORF Transcript_112291/g.349905 Transcript_112291/m.349905 type:complete len:227 (-) Transcript_112291:168-848(-)
MGSKPTIRFRSLALRNSSIRTFQTVASRTMYSTQKSIRQTVSTLLRIGAAVGASVRGRTPTWNSSTVERTKQSDEITIMVSTTKETIWANMDESGSSNVRKILSHRLNRTVMFRCLYTLKNSIQETYPSPFSSNSFTQNPFGSCSTKNKRWNALWNASTGSFSSPGSSHEPKQRHCARSRLKTIRRKSRWMGCSRGTMKLVELKRTHCAITRPLVPWRSSRSKSTR